MRKLSAELVDLDKDGYDVSHDLRRVEIHEGLEELMKTAPKQQVQNWLIS